MRLESTDDEPVPRLLPILLLSALILGSGCRTITTRRLSLGDPAEPRIASPARAWEVSNREEIVGIVVYFEAHGPVQDSLFMVQNVWHQDLGLIDAYGRAYRYVPHHREPAWVGSGTVVQGVGRILGMHECTLAEIELPAEKRAISPGELEQRRIAAPNSLSLDS